MPFNTNNKSTLKKSDDMNKAEFFLFEFLDFFFRYKTLKRSLNIENPLKT